MLKRGPQAEPPPDTGLGPTQYLPPPAAHTCRQLRELLRQLHTKNPELRFAGKGKPKTCSYCGGKGHTVRGCEQRKMDEAKAAGIPAEELLPGGKPKASKQRRPPTCGLCGQLGHSKRYCPQQAAAGAASTAAIAVAGVADATGAAAVAPPIEAAVPAQAAAGTQPAVGSVQHVLPAAEEEGPGAAASVPSAPTPLVSRDPLVSAVAAPPAEEDLRARVEQSAKALGSGAAAAPAAAAPAGTAAAAAAATLPAGSPMAGPQVLWQLGAELGSPAQALQEAPTSKPAEVLRKGQGPAADGVAQAAGKQRQQHQQQRTSLAASMPATASAANAGKAVLASPKPAQAAATSVSAVQSAAGAGSSTGSAVPAAAPAAAEQSSSSSTATAAAPAQPAAKSAEAATAPPLLPPSEQQQPPTQPPQQQQQQQGRTPRAPATPPPTAPAAAVTAASFSNAASSVSYDDAGLPTWELGSSGMLLDPDGGLVFPLPTRQSDCILQVRPACLCQCADSQPACSHVACAHRCLGQKLQACVHKSCATHPSRTLSSMLPAAAFTIQCTLLIPYQLPSDTCCGHPPGMLPSCPDQQTAPPPPPLPPSSCAGCSGCAARLGGRRAVPVPGAAAAAEQPRGAGGRRLAGRHQAAVSRGAAHPGGSAAPTKDV